MSDETRPRPTLDLTVTQNDIAEAAFLALQFSILNHAKATMATTGKFPQELSADLRESAIRDAGAYILALLPSTNGFHASLKYWVDNDAIPGIRRDPHLRLVHTPHLEGPEK